MFYSQSTRGFYSEAIHGPRSSDDTMIPSDAVAISDAEYAAMMAGQSLGKEISPDADGRPVVQDPSPPTVDQVKAKLLNLVQRHMDDAARARGYDSLLAAVSYADEPAVEQFQDEGQAFRAWRSLVWASCYTLLAEVQAEQRAVPTEAELLELLPELVL